jgi:hypothetical protein
LHTCSQHSLRWWTDLAPACHCDALPLCSQQPEIGEGLLRFFKLFSSDAEFVAGAFHGAMVAFLQTSYILTDSQRIRDMLYCIHAVAAATECNARALASAGLFRVIDQLVMSHLTKADTEMCSFLARIIESMVSNEVCATIVCRDAVSVIRQLWEISATDSAIERTLSESLFHLCFRDSIRSQTLHAGALRLALWRLAESWRAPSRDPRPFLFLTRSIGLLSADAGNVYAVYFDEILADNRYVQAVLSTLHTFHQELDVVIASFSTLRLLAQSAQLCQIALEHEVTEAVRTCLMEHGFIDSLVASAMQILYRVFHLSASRPWHSKSPRLSASGWACGLECVLTALDRLGLGDKWVIDALSACAIACNGHTENLWVERGVPCLLGLLERPVTPSANNDQQCFLMLQSLQRAVERRPCAAMTAKHSAPEIILSLLFRLGGELAICAAQQVAPQGAKEEPSVVVKLACTDLVAQIGLAVVEHVEILKVSSSQSRSRWAKALSMHSDSEAVVRACCQSGFVTYALRFPVAA